MPLVHRPECHVLTTCTTRERHRGNFDRDVCYIDTVHTEIGAASVRDFYRDLGSRIRTRRGKRFTQQTLAERVGLSRAAIANIELGRQGVPTHMLARFAAALDVAPVELLPEAREPSEERQVTEAAKLMPRDRETVMRVLSRARQEGPGNT